MKKTIRDYDLEGKKVIIRCDFNVPMENGIITDETRIIASLETIKYAIENGAKVILMSHLGKVSKDEDKKNNSLYPVSIRLAELLGINVMFSPDTRGSKLEDLVNSLGNKEVLLIENTRYEDIEGKKESSCDDELSKYWASLGDLFINDAYGSSHRAHASTYGIPSNLPSGIGFLVEKEVLALNNILSEDTHPFVVVMGGKKVVDKIPVTSNLITKCDKLIVGGGMSYTYLKALGYNVGQSIVDEESIEFCKELLSKYKDKIVLPIDVVTTKEFNNAAPTIIKKIDDIKEDEMGLDMGPETLNLYETILKDAKRVIVNGPLGVFEMETFSKGTKRLYEILSENNIKTLIGGGDSAASVNKLGFDGKFYHISTGGGATLEYLEGKELPGISIINEE